MANFIEVTSRDKVGTCNGTEFKDFKVLINIEQIIEVDEHRITTSMRRIATKESYEQIKEKLELASINNCEVRML